MASFPISARRRHRTAQLAKVITGLTLLFTAAVELDAVVALLLLRGFR